RTRADGRYAILVPTGTKRVGMVAYVAGNRPAGLSAAVREEGVSDVPALVVVPGETLAGTVLGRPIPPSTRVRIAWYGAARSGAGAIWDGVLVALAGPQPVVATIWAPLDDHARFRADGLERAAPAPHGGRA